MRFHAGSQPTSTRQGPKEQRIGILSTGEGWFHPRHVDRPCRVKHCLLGIRRRSFGIKSQSIVGIASSLCHPNVSFASTTRTGLFVFSSCKYARQIAFGVDADPPPTAQVPCAGRSQPITTSSSNGPRTFEEACIHFGFTPEEAQKLALCCSLVPSPSQTLLQVAQSISQAGCAPSHSYSQQISGKGEHSSTPYVNVAPLAPLQPCASPTTPLRLATRPDPNYLSHWEAISNNAAVSLPDHVGSLSNAGESPLMAFVDRRAGMFCCLVPVEGEFCGYLNAKKERMMSHIRGRHLNQRPYRCGGQCGHDTW